MRALIFFLLFARFALIYYWSILVVSYRWVEVDFLVAIHACIRIVLVPRQLVEKEEKSIQLGILNLCQEKQFEEGKDD